jgi:hypothetical protein
VEWAAPVDENLQTPVIAHLGQELAPMALYLATFLRLKG